jgi:ring-1,2-phenylacetyl-CoA epoxidase subunit PaaD
MVSASLVDAEQLIAQAWQLLEAIPDPEIPVVSIRELGILRELRASSCGRLLEVVITPTYSGCPAIDAIAHDITQTLTSAQIKSTIITQLAPAWTTDWMTAEGRRKLREYGIAPPAETVADAAGLAGTNVLRFTPRGDIDALVACPRCASTTTSKLSQYGSTACKALYKCLACSEPFDYFKPH